jgi:protein-histidine pros-kinase
MRIELRFGVILAFCFVLGVMVAGYISYTLEFRQAREEVTEKAHVLLTTALSVRAYTVEEVADLIGELGNEKAFHPQMVPSYAAQTTMKRLQMEFPEYTYRESSLNPTNVADRASDWEVGLIRAFRQDAAVTELSGEVGLGTDSRFYVSRPIRLSNPACLECHTTPDVAPKSMVAKYGTGNGFNWTMGDIVGVQIVEVPVLPTRQKAFNGVLITVGSLTCVFVLTAAIFLMLLRRYVTSPLRSITRSAQSLSLDRMPLGSDNASQLDGQFRDLEQAVTRLKTSLDQATRLFRGKDD